MDISTEDLLQNDQRILDAALDLGFSSHEYFTKMPVQFIEGLGIESGVDPLDTLWNNFHHKYSLKL